MRIHKIAAASVLSVIAAGTIVATTATSANAFSFGTVTVSPSKNLIENQQIQVNISGFGSDTGDGTTTGTVLYVVECTPAITAPPNSPTHCDESDPTDPNQSPSVPNHVVKITNANNGSATATFHVHTGANWLGKAPGDKCDFQHSCYVVVTDGQTAATTNWAGFAQVTFKDTRATTSTKVTAPKTLKAGKTLKLKAKTKGTGSLTGGTVTFKDGSKTIAKVKEKASGVVKAKEKHAKHGKHKITVSYSGNSKNKPSAGKAKVKVK